jgi:hypothetical protein
MPFLRIFAITLSRTDMTSAGECQISRVAHDHRSQSSSASRLTAADSGFLLLSQCGDLPEL